MDDKRPNGLIPVLCAKHLSRRHLRNYRGPPSELTWRYCVEKSLDSEQIGLQLHIAMLLSPPLLKLWPFDWIVAEPLAKPSAGSHACTFLNAARPQAFDQKADSILTTCGFIGTLQLDHYFRYRAELVANAGALEPIVKAARRVRVTLVYSSHDEEHNDAVVLKPYVESHLGRHQRTQRAA